MRVTIIPADSVVVVDGVTVDGVLLEGISAEVHAVQWYGTWGDVEICDPETHAILENRRINSFDEYAFVLPLWQQRSVEVEAAKSGTLPITTL